MRFFSYISVFAAAVLSAAGCSGTQDTNSLPELRVSDSEIDLATATTATFTVTYEGQDVTADSRIMMAYPAASVRSMERDPAECGPEFNPGMTGTYEFHAVYDGKVSNVVTVNVVNTDAKVESEFDKHVCIAEFTGAWCVNCPDGLSKMNLMLSTPSMAKYRDNIHVCSFHWHNGTPESDIMSIDETDRIFKQYGLGGYPAFLVDFGGSGLLNDENGVDKLKEYLKSALDDYYVHCGVAVSSILNSDRSKAEVTLKVKSELTSEYRAVLLVVEDGVVGPQKMNGYKNGENPNYIHRHVVRKVIKSDVGEFIGETITADGTIGAGEEKSRKWTIDVDGQWDLEKTGIYALVFDSNEKVNNMNVCAIDGGDSDYDKEKKN